MRGNWWLILLLLLGVWQIVGTLIEKAGKKQQEQRLKDLAAQRERQRGTQVPSSPPQRPVTDRAEALAARRRQQLEQLRQRRAGQKPSVQPPTTPTPTARPAPAAPPQAGRRAVAHEQSGQRPVVQAQPGTFQASRGGQPTPVPVARRPAAQPPAARPSAPRPPRRMPVRTTPERPPTRQPAPAPTEEPAEVEGESTTRRVVLGAEESVAPARPKRHLPLPFTPGEPLGPHLLRQMVLFREILEPPVSLRDRQVWERM